MLVTAYTSRLRYSICFLELSHKQRIAHGSGASVAPPRFPSQPLPTATMAIMLSEDQFNAMMARIATA